MLVRRLRRLAQIIKKRQMLDFLPQRTPRTAKGRVNFLLNLHRFNVPMIDYEEDELLSDMQNA
jgi:hypothetical protein